MPDPVFMLLVTVFIPVQLQMVIALNACLLSEAQRWLPGISMAHFWPISALGETGAVLLLVLFRRSRGPRPPPPLPENPAACSATGEKPAGSRRSGAAL